MKVTAGKKPRAVAREWAFGKSKEKGTDYISVAFEILEPEEERGAPVPWNGYFTDKTAKRTLEALRYCGWKGDDLTSLDGMGTQEVALVVELEDYDGKQYPKVAWVNRLGGAGVRIEKPMDDREKKQLAARMKSLARSLPEVKGPASEPLPSTPAVREREPGEDDEPLPGTSGSLPF